MMSFPDELAARIERCGVISVLTVDRAEAAVPLARALLDGGVDVIELTLRTPAAMECLSLIRRKVPEMLVGIGTILTPQQVAEVSAAGAAFGVAPGCNPQVIQAATDHGLPFAPGIVTPSDIESAVQLGCRYLKFFPAEPSGGLDYLRSMAAPYAQLELRYIPLGGLNEKNCLTYLASPYVPAVGGSWLAPRAAIQDSDWSAITERSANSRRLVDELRSETAS